jgi:hypothetical protein
MVQFMLGADPEIFVKKNGQPISAYGLIPGTKKEPYKTELGAVQVDGMALEFNINPTSSNDFEGFNTNIVKTISDLRNLAGNVKLSIEPVQEFPPEYMAAQPEEAKELGCDPDFNAYTLEPNPRPPGDRNFRTGAGHVHIGWGADIPTDNPEHFEICAGFVKMLDATVGMYMTYIDRDPRRRDLYGKAGAFRPKTYGVEYRTPSNLWIRNKNRRWMMHYMINKAIFYMSNGVKPEKVARVPEEEIVRIINDGDYLAAVPSINGVLGGHSYSGSWLAIVKEMDVKPEDVPF